MVALLITIFLFIIRVNSFVSLFFFIIWFFVTLILIGLQLTSVLIREVLACISTEASLFSLTHIVELFSNSLVIIVIFTVKDLFILCATVLILKLVNNLFLFLAPLVILHIIHIKFMLQVVNVSEFLYINGVETLKFTFKALIFFLIFRLNIFDTLKTFI